jgi:hypothetical protein
VQTMVRALGKPNCRMIERTDAAPGLNGKVGLVVVVNWQKKSGGADRVANILRHFLPQAQEEPGAELF